MSTILSRSAGVPTTALKDYTQTQTRRSKLRLCKDVGRLESRLTCCQICNSDCISAGSHIMGTDDLGALQDGHGLRR